MPGQARRQRRLIAAAVGLLALVSGCSDTGTGPADAPAAQRSAAGPTPLPSLSLPRVADGCHPDDGWTPKEQSDWTRVHIKEYLGSFEVTLLPTTYQMTKSGYNRPLCTPFPIQVEYWRVTYTDVPDAAGAPVDRYTFALAPVARTQLVVDGRQEQAVHQPAGFTAANCVGLLMAVYAGGPMQEGELPQRITDQAAVLGEFAKFNTDRIAQQVYVKPHAPKGC